MSMQRIASLVGSLLSITLVCGTAAAVEYKIATADPKGTYYAIGQDLAKYVAPDAGIELEVLPTDGSAANIKHLRYDPGVKLAIVQADVYQAFVDRAAAGNREAAAMIGALRVILPLYNTEIHFIARADAPMNYLHEIRDAKINGGLVGSGAAFITHTLYRMMFGKPIPEANTSLLSNADALLKLISDKSVDVAVVAAGQPAPLITNMRPEAQKFIKLLKFDPAHPSSKLPLTVYTQSVVRAESYPNLLKESFTTIAVGAYLVTYNFATPETANHLARFTRALCSNFPTLQTKGHPKWREVNLSLPKLSPGWTYYSPAARQLRACSVPAKQRPRAKACSAEERILGLCE
jgi:TRAP transporter TAXI family solute receptor